MTRSALDEFALASHMLRRAARLACSKETDDVTDPSRELRLHYPDALSGLPNPDAATTEDYLTALVSGGSRVASGMIEGLVAYARARYGDGTYREAVRIFGLCLVIDPTLATAAVMHASAMELAHPRAEFLTPARRATILAPLRADAWKLTMRGSYAKGHLGAAVAQAKRYIILEPNSSSGWLVLARTRFRGGQPDQALGYLRLSRTLAPKQRDIRVALARCLFRLGNFKTALRENDAAARLGAAGPEHDFERARIVRAAGRLDLAIPLLDRLEADNETFREQRRILELTATIDDLRAPR